MDATRELGEFLRSRRARLTPQDLDLPEYGPRRVPGLRREEVAALAGVSAVYYTRLEQGRAANPSTAVLNALARVLRLDPTERTHLRDLARLPSRGRARADGTGTGIVAPGSGGAGTAGVGAEGGAGVGVGAGGAGGVAGAGAGAGTTVGAVRVRPGLRRLLDAVGAVPAYVLGPDMTVLAANRLAGALVLDPVGASVEGLNLARHILLDPAARELYPQWADVARQTVGFLRFSAGRYGGQPGFAALIAELSAGSTEFPALWAAHEVREKTWGSKRFRHRVVGEFELHYETIGLPGDEGCSLVILSPDPDSADDTALRLLGSWSAEAPARRPAGR
ncbi:helix-turn-helix transcriptional regulator [Kitasatospora sp. NPDC088346]|uniref:helix-turn-helix transcriptional regulator n=1 Tax=Kitasatospora sp. NPDC088346 TaxID=3364073 RepID=UPI003829CCAD